MAEADIEASHMINQEVEEEIDLVIDLKANKCKDT